jgi:quercetin dioxygenase-like cupin family protein
MSEQEMTFEQWFIHSSYQDFIRREGAPMYEGSALSDLGSLKLADWERRGGKVAYTRLGDQEEHCLQIVEIPPGGQLKPEHHMYDAIMYVMRGQGATTIWQEGEPKRTVEWHEGSLLAIPLNAWHQEFNNSGTEPCRMLFGTNMAHVINFYNNLDFVFNCPVSFTDRYSFKVEKYFDYRKHWTLRMLETNFLPDIRNFSLDAYPERGGRTAIMRLAMSNVNLGMHVMSVSEGTYATAHRHPAGAHVIVIEGTGYELLFMPGEESERQKVDASAYAVVAPKLNEFHQHFNSGKGEYKMLAFRGTGLRYGWGGSYDPARTAQSKDPYQMSFMISPDKEDPIIREEYYKELAKNGVEARLAPVEQRGS